eukprot:scaffold795_cov195-Alexandrium_tamarense.AAC.14
MAEGATQQTVGGTIAGTLGNVLEWYGKRDVIGDVFFPPSDSSSGSASELGYDDNLMKSFAVYGGAFLMRPIGGMLIGTMGDKYGRKHALVISLFLMAVPTFLMGCLPTLAQGMSVGDNCLHLSSTRLKCVLSRSGDSMGLL